MRSFRERDGEPNPMTGGGDGDRLASRSPKEVSLRTKAWTRMTQLTTLAVGLGVAAGVAWSGEQLGMVKSVDQGQKTVLLNDGTRLWLVPGLSLDLFTQGKRVKVVYDEREGKKWVRSVETPADAVPIDRAAVLVETLGPPARDLAARARRPAAEPPGLDEWREAGRQGGLSP